MSRIPKTRTGLQITLLALLPRDGTPVTVHRLAKATAVSEYQVTNAFFDLYLDREVNFDVRADAYSAAKQQAPATSGCKALPDFGTPRQPGAIA